jgi:hypothetical protein
VARFFFSVFYNRFLPDFFAAAHRFRIPSAMRLRAAADMVRLFGARPAVAELVLALLVVPGGLPRRFGSAEAPPARPSKACIAASSLFFSAPSC